MAERKIWEADNDVAEQAMKAAVKVMETGDTRTRLQAAKTVLDFTQRKPVTASELTLNKAEAFLESILNDEAGTAGAP